MGSVPSETVRILGINKVLKNEAYKRIQHKTKSGPFVKREYVMSEITKVTTQKNAINKMVSTNSSPISSALKITILHTGMRAADMRERQKKTENLIRLFKFPLPFSTKNSNSIF
jgi:hypothetical protein